MLSIQRDMIKTHSRILDLEFRFGVARAHRLLVFVDMAQQVAAESAEADLELSLDCRERAGDYATLGTCLERLTQSLVLREAQVRALERLLTLSDDDLAMLGAPVEARSQESTSPPRETQRRQFDTVDQASDRFASDIAASEPETLAELGHAARSRLDKAREERKNEGIYEIS